jgi:ribosomal protein S1
VLKKGDDVRARITNIDIENQRVTLSIKEFLPNEWDSFVGENSVGDTVTGRVVNVTDFGLFVDIYEGLEGLAHVSEIETSGDGLEGQYSLGDWVSARILRIEEEDKKVGLTMRGVAQPSEDEIQEMEAAHQEALRAAAEVEQALSEEEYEAARLAAAEAEQKDVTPEETPTAEEEAAAKETEVEASVAEPVEESIEAEEETAAEETEAEASVVEPVEEAVEAEEAEVGPEAESHASDATEESEDAKVE